MSAKLTRMTHKIAIQLFLVAESSTICSSCSRRQVRKLLDTPSYQRAPNNCLPIYPLPCTICFPLRHIIFIHPSLSTW